MMEELTEEGKKAQREYYREYRKKRRDKKRQQNIRYWNKKGRQLDEEKSDDEVE